MLAYPGKISLSVALFAACALAAGCSRDDAERAVQDAHNKARKVIENAGAHLQGMAQTAADVKRELDKVYKTTTEYDLVISEETGDAKLKAHQARLLKMDRVEVQGLTVGYEQREDLTCNGTTFARHFRATWVMGDRVVGVSYFSQREINAAAFVQLLERMVPIVGEQITRNVAIKRGGA
ncbi:MAG: hypothetical protein L0Z62_45810 [Gemmataceae bacterium]|nr:hypothetical protein [Gemmataceae bacterium]